MFSPLYMPAFIRSISDHLSTKALKSHLPKLALPSSIYLATTAGGVSSGIIFAVIVSHPNAMAARRRILPDIATQRPWCGYTISSLIFVYSASRCIDVFSVSKSISAISRGLAGMPGTCPVFASMSATRKTILSTGCCSFFPIGKKYKIMHSRCGSRCLCVVQYLSASVRAPCGLRLS